VTEAGIGGCLSGVERFDSPKIVIGRRLRFCGVSALQPPLGLVGHRSWSKRPQPLGDVGAAVAPHPGVNYPGDTGPGQYTHGDHGDDHNGDNGGCTYKPRAAWGIEDGGRAGRLPISSHGKRISFPGRRRGLPTRDQFGEGLPVAVRLPPAG